MKIYQTDDMEEATRLMTKRNENSVLFQFYSSLRRIRFRGNKIADIPTILVRPRDAFFGESIAAWREQGGLLQYNHDARFHDIPSTEALLYIESPLQYRNFLEQTKNVKREVVVYRPPTWALHESSIDVMFPMSDSYFTLLSIIRGIMGQPLTPRFEGALKAFGSKPEDTSVFEASDIEDISGITPRQLKVILFGTRMRWRNQCARYHCYKPQIEPDEDCDEGMRWAYGLLEAEPDCWNGERMLKHDTLSQGRVPEFLKFLKRLVRGAYVTRYSDIFVVTSGYKPDYVLIDAIASARRADWYRMRNVVDDAEEYPINFGEL